MPSHIFTRLGLWQEAIKSNLDSHAAARAYAVKHHLKDAWDEQLHAMDYLVYAYLQGAEDKKALAVLSELNKIRRVDPLTFKVAYATAAIPARYALERRQWKEAANLPVYPAGMPNFPWAEFPWAESHIHFARAIGAARTGDVGSAKKELDALVSARNSLAVARGEYDWATDLDTKRQLVTAWITFAEGTRDGALKIMQEVAKLDDSIEKHPVTPGTLLPAREQLGELLIELNKPGEALVEYEAALRLTPNRFNAVLGAARAANLANDSKKATEYYRMLIELCRFGESARPELDEARKFLRTNRSISITNP
jgi:tetratricopeptide (TPR) repeat protein